LSLIIRLHEGGLSKGGVNRQPGVRRLLLYKEGVVLVGAEAEALPTEVQRLAYDAVVPLACNGCQAAEAALSISMHKQTGLLLLLSLHSLFLEVS
jgi:hypothetical protein